ncbi:MAG: hypothetical protein E3J64_00565 [Anaerolineales bacterium]|nr:MAG: hypothetical protein E3J64_00565 [Anaerolineales bacterium]
MAKPQDIYMQFADVSVAYHATDVTNVVEGFRNTGLSIRGGLVWLIHMIEILFIGIYYHGNTDQKESIALSTVTGLTSMPLLGRKGTLCKAELDHGLTTSGAASGEGPKILRYLPPIPFAAPSVRIYGACLNNQVPMQGKTIEARIGYTTEAIDKATYAELAEVWEQST